MRCRGYEIHHRSADYRMVSMTKHIESKNITVHAEIFDNEDMVKLTCIVGLFTIDSPKFYIRHERFKDLFEDNLVRYAYICEYSSL